MTEDVTTATPAPATEEPMPAAALNGASANGSSDVATPGGDAGAIPESAERSPAEHRTADQLFQFSRYVHVGPGAETCEDGEDGACSNPLHFHAWIRLPNQFQNASIREKAMAAKARGLRELRDPESDKRAILDAELEDLARADSREALIDELAGRDMLRDHMSAMEEVAEDEEFEHIEEDQERLRSLEATPEEDRPGDEYERLQKHILAHAQAVEKARDVLQKPLRDSLADKPTPELIELLRDDRIASESEQEFNTSFSMWEWYIGTLRPKAPNKPGLPSERVFTHIDHLKAAAPEVIQALGAAFGELEVELGRTLRKS